MNEFFSRDARQARITRAVTQWWMLTAEAEAKAVVAKAVQYGPNSLIRLGRRIARRDDLPEAEAIERACYFYLEGKVGRWEDAIDAGEPVSDDTLHDIGVYVRMIQYVRKYGSWPVGTIIDEPEPMRGATSGQVVPPGAAITIHNVDGTTQEGLLFND